MLWNGPFCIMTIFGTIKYILMLILLHFYLEYECRTFTWNKHSKRSQYFLHHCLFYPLFFFGSRQKQKTLPSQTQHTFLSFLPDHVCNPVLSQSQSVPVIPLRGMRPEATQVWETVLCWLNFPHTPLPAQPALPATSVHTAQWASINQNRAHRLKTHKMALF